MQIGSLLISGLKIVGLLAFLYGLLWVMGVKVKSRQLSNGVRFLGIAAAFALIQLALTVKFGPNGETRIFTDFDQGLLFQACAITMVAMGLNLIYGFNGQFSLGQWGFYGIGAYCSADITYRWVNGDARGLLVVGIGTILGALMIWGVNKLLSRLRGIPVLSSFTIYLVGTIAVAALAVWLGNQLNPLFEPLLVADGALRSEVAMQVVFFLAVVFAGIFAAEISFLFGLPVLSLGSDYFGIATLGFTIVVNVLMVNSDTILPFPEMKGGRGMIGIPKLTTWFWAFLFLIIVIIVMRNMIRSSTGRAIMSVREDETAAKAMGVDVARTKLLAFVVGSLFAGLGGGIYAHFIGFLSPGSFSFLLSFNPLIIIVFGGLGSMTGTLVATFGWMFFLEGMLRTVLADISTEAPQWRFVLYPLTLLLLMLVRPQGLLGNVEWGFFKAARIRRQAKLENAVEAETGGGS